MKNIAIAGLRHGHIYTLYNWAKAHPGLNILGAWEEDPQARAVGAEKIAEPFYTSYEALLNDPRVDIVAIGDYYGIRGKRILQALEHGKAVIGDKPLCTSLEELDAICRISEEKQLPVGCMLDLRENPQLCKAASLIAEGAIGQIRAVHFTGQHALDYGNRPGWYFEPGKHGGTFNDIAVHGIDAVSWMTGSRFERALFARQWNDFAEKEPHFLDSAHFSGLLENGAALTADVSYAAPRGTALPTYWRFTFWGRDGWIECNLLEGSLQLARSGDPKPTQILDCPKPEKTVLGEFVKEVEAGTPGEHTRTVLLAARECLRLQKFADETN